MPQMYASIRSRITAFLIAALIPLSLSLYGCGNGSGGNGSGGTNFGLTASVAIVVTPASIAVNPGEARPFYGVVTGTSNSGVTWAVTEGSSGGTVSGTGVYTAPATAGTYHLMATSVVDSTKSATATISVMDLHGIFFGDVDMRAVSGIHTATLLASGKVLVAGGSDGYTEDYTEAGDQLAELYDPVGGTFSDSIKMTSPRTFHNATLLQDGMVLLTGGFGSGFDQPPILSSAELYDPGTNTFSAISNMTTARAAHTATLLPNGKVLIAGGGTSGGWGFPAFGAGDSSAELYDPVTNSFTPTGAMNTPRFAHTATLLPNGKVLIAGGFSEGTIFTTMKALASSEFYDPSTGVFTPGPDMTQARGGHTATLLANGIVLIAGGLAQIGDISNYLVGPGDPDSVALASADLLDLSSGQFISTGNMTIDREEHTATLLPDGRVLIAGGATGSHGTLDSAELYDPATGAFSITDSMASQRSAHSATLLNNDTVLITGGNSGGGRYDTGATGGVHTAELFRVLP